MRKSLSYVLPILALLVVAVLAFRWLNSRPQTDSGEISSSAEGIEISDLTGDDTLPSGIDDGLVIDLVQPVADATAEATPRIPAQGELRYSVQPDSGRTVFSVTADLPEIAPADGFYQLWFESENGRKKAMQLELGKAGYMGEGVISSEFEQVRVILSRETTDDEEVEEVLLEGTLDLSPQADETL